MQFRILRRVAVLSSIASAGYLLFLRPWHLHWGATPVEVRRPMPGDSLVPAPDLIATRAVTIAAPPAVVWPWLVQMGYGRAGWYSYDWLDNDGIRVTSIIPEFQHLQVGDVLHTAPEGGFRVEELVPERLLVMMIHGSEIGFNVAISCVILLEPLDCDSTRLVVRLRAVFHGLRARLWALLFDFGDFVMMRKMLLGIKQRAERVAAH